MLLEPILYAIAALVALVVPCELGQWFSKAFSEINDVVDQFNWYLFPIEVQRILPTVILYMQQPIEIEFFGKYSCNRQQCKRVRMKLHKSYVHTTYLFN